MLRCWRSWNKKLSKASYSMFCDDEETLERAAEQFPYNWWYIMIPIAGICMIHYPTWYIDYCDRLEQLADRRRKQAEDMHDA